MCWSVSWVNPLKALKKTQENQKVTKGGGFKLAVGLMSRDLNIKIQRLPQMQSEITAAD